MCGGLALVNIGQAEIVLYRKVRNCKIAVGFLVKIITKHGIIMLTEIKRRDVCMSVYEIVSTLSVSSTVIPMIVSAIIEIITKKINTSKNKVSFNEFLDCIEITQKEFAQHYNEKYEMDSQTLFSHVLNISANSQNGEYDIDGIIADLIKNSFDAEPTDQMIDAWKKYFIKNINNTKYSDLKIFFTSSSEDNKNVSYAGENLANYGTTNIFLSYSWKDEKKANEIDTFFSALGINIKRDKKSIEQWGSIRAFMDSIQSSDYAILIISDAYLKSVNCMYEITQLMKEPHYRDRIFPVVLENEIYQLKKRIDYIVYWEEKYDEAKQEISRVKNLENTEQLSKELHQIREISYTIGEFLDIIKDMNNPQAEGINQAIYERLCEKNLLRRDSA